MTQINHRFSGKIICEGDGTIRKLAEKNKTDLRDAYLRGADLGGAYLGGADLRGADLRDAYLRGADLGGADLRHADLRGADMRDAYLRGAEIKFWQFPSIRLLSSMNLGTLSDALTTELFRRDMAAHPKPELFEKWAKGDSECPYVNEERFWYFDLRKECWKLGKPKMSDVELIFAICKEKKWSINGYK